MHTKRVAFITGANKGLGLEIARQLGQQGVTVVVGARDKAKANEAADKLKGEGIDAHAVKLDVTNEADIAALPDFFKSKFGRLDILVNNAGITLDFGGVTIRHVPPNLRNERLRSLLHHAGAAAVVEGQPGWADCQSFQHYGINSGDGRFKQRSHWKWSRRRTVRQKRR